MGKNLKGKELGIGMSQRPNGLYEYRFTIDGKRYTVYGKTIAETQKKSDEKKKKVLTTSNVIRSSMTFSEWFDKWFREYKSPYLKNTQSRLTYETIAKNTFLRLLGDVKLQKLTHFQVQSASNILSDDEGVCADYVKSSVSIFRQCIDVAIKNDLIEKNPFDSVLVKANKTEKAKKFALTNSQQKIILDALDGSHYEYFYKTLLLTGMRAGEFGGLRWEDIDWDKRVIHVERSMSVVHHKGNVIIEVTKPKTETSVRDIPFFGETEKVLRDWEMVQNRFKEKHGSSWRKHADLGNLVFTTTYGDPITRFAIDSHMRRLETKIKEKYGTEIPHIHAHILRHTFATRCFEKGMKPLVVKIIMGHSRYTMTEYYTHAEEEAMKEADRIGNFL